MAPQSLLSSFQDDFIMTLSDNEVTISDIENQPEQLPQSTGKKRKRSGDENRSKTGKKGQKNLDGGKLKDTISLEGSDAGTIPWDPNGEEDEALASDFEFGDTTTDLLEDFDDFNGAAAERGINSSGKKLIDIDEIIARRRNSKNHSEKRAQDDQDEDEDEDADAESRDMPEASDADFPGDLDGSGDEMLADDVFGMGAVDSQEQEQDDDDDDNDGSDEDERDDYENAAEDNSVASPVAHPDDLAADDASEDDEDDEDDPIEAARRDAFFAAGEADIRANVNDTKSRSFQNLSLSRPILRGITSLGFVEPTPVQAKTIPVALLGKDVVGGAVTGSGKTAAFLIPILERLLYRPKKVPTSRVAILMPTRELAVQCYNVAVKLASFTDITFCQLVGGFSLREQEAILKKRPDVIIATPGRFIDHMRNSASFTVDTLEILVLDEADRMLEEGFKDELNEILSTIPKSRQTMLFSATMTDSVDKLIRLGLNKPVRLLIDSKKQTVGTLVQEFVRLRPGKENKRLGCLMYLCESVFTAKVIIFFRQKREAHRVRIIFGLFGLRAAELHGNMTQDQRMKSVEDFRDGKVSFLLATDVASRGLDIKGVNTVINYEAPQSHEIYLHRVGRTARAGRTGRACTIAAEPDRKVVKIAVKTGRQQGAKIVSRVIEPAIADTWTKKVEDLQEEIEGILKEEKQEKQLSQAELQVRRGENIITHEEEIMSRPKRTWFESEQEKRLAKKKGREELNGPDSIGKKSKVKLSGKQKKKLQHKDLRQENKGGWKKGKAERQGKGALAPQKKKGKSAKSKSKP